MTHADTEIDWSTYMQQVSLYVSGERDYPSIKGSTGPLVYPAAHVYVYTLLYHLTDQGRDILTGQIIFAGLYLSTLAVVFGCYQKIGAPGYLFPLLVLSKRLHSIFMLRMFNDGVATFAMWLAIWLFLRRQWTLGVLAWTLGVGVKMTLVLMAPAIAVITLLSVGLTRSICLGAIALQIQETFLSRDFSVALLLLHVSILALFSIAWVKPSRSNVFRFLQDTIQGRQPRVELSNSFIMTTMLSSLTIGMLCARSLHYQFFAYLAWASPYLLWRAGLHPAFIVIAWALQEWSWNVYPSTNASSVVVVLSLALQVFGVWFNGQGEVYRKPVVVRKEVRT
ncbi:hypothetical protein N7454_002660 [Penicillium verhagenii]|nr:hypothetical protein N7454_002660 [Penicillium verhagenii]